MTVTTAGYGRADSSKFRENSGAFALSSAQVDWSVATRPSVGLPVRRGISNQKMDPAPDVPLTSKRRNPSSGLWFNTAMLTSMRPAAENLISFPTRFMMI